VLVLPVIIHVSSVMNITIAASSKIVIADTAPVYTQADIIISIKKNIIFA
jgi:hypothetical protein